MSSPRDKRIDIRVLAFDVFGTLVDWRGGIVAELNEIARKRGLLVDSRAVADAWRKRARVFLDRISRGEMPYRVLDEIHRVTLDELVGQFGLELLTEKDRERLVFAWHHLPPWPDVVSGLSQLRAGHILTALSNGGMAHLIDVARSAKLPFDCILSTELVQSYKPDPKVYELVPSLLRVQPGQAMMVASHAYDLAAAAAVGFRTAFVRRPREWGDGAKEEPYPSADLVAEDLVDLASQLRAPIPAS